LILNVNGISKLNTTGTKATDSQFFPLSIDSLLRKDFLFKKEGENENKTTEKDHMFEFLNAYF
jgi:hypothetical protein